MASCAALKVLPDRVEHVPYPGNSNFGCRATRPPASKIRLPVAASSEHAGPRAQQRGPGIKRTSPALRSQGCCTNTKGLTVWGAAPTTGATSPAVGGPQHHEAARRFEAGPPERPAGPSYGVQCASRRSKPQSAIADLYFAEELQACLGHDAHQGLAAAEMLPLQSRLQERHTDGPCCAADEPHNASAMLPSGVAEWLLFTDAAHLVLDRPKLASERGRSKSA
jgi:hypothetical protein